VIGNGNDKMLGVLWMQTTVEDEQSFSLCSDIPYLLAEALSNSLRLTFGEDEKEGPMT